MNISQSFKLALKSILTSKMRSILTMLGIIIGVGSVIILISLMQGLTNEILSTFESLGTNVLQVEVYGRGSSRAISVDDMYKICDDNKDIFLGVSPQMYVSGNLKYGTESFYSNVMGVAENYMMLNDWKIKEGRFLSYADVRDYHKVAVVGSYVNQNTYGGKAIGDYIKIDGNKYMIIGVLEEKADSTEWSADDCFFVPYTTASKMAYASINSYIYTTKDTQFNAEAKSKIENTLYSVMQGDTYYNITDMSDLVSEITEMTGTMTLVLVGIAGISLLVGGIGIMNIMLVSVTERTREIGIRKSLGAKRRDIMSQFIIEAATTSALGGVIGIVIGVLVSGWLGDMIEIQADPTPTAIMISFSISVFIGILFGFLPANKASKLNPIDALRHD